MDHLERTRQEFSRQAASFAASAAITDQSQVARLVAAIGGAARGRVLDVACGPGIVTSALAERAQQVVALDLTPQMLEKRGSDVARPVRQMLCSRKALRQRCLSLTPALMQ